MTPEQFEFIKKWQKDTFPNATDISKLNHLSKEIGELKDAINDEDHTIDHEKVRKVRMEFADCFLLLFGAAASYGLTYENICHVIDTKMEINKARKWGEPNEQGFQEHIK